MFQLNAPVVIRVKIKEVRTTLLFITMLSTPLTDTPNSGHLTYVAT